MNQQQLIDSITKEVKRVLALKGIQVSPRSKSGYSAGKAASTGTLPMPAHQDFAIGRADVSGKQVVTLRDIENCGGASIRVSARAIITPLAVDYARGKGIAIVRDNCNQAAGSGMSKGQVCIAVSPDQTGKKKALTDMLKKNGYQLSDVSGSDYETAVKKLSESVASGSMKFGVCVEKTGMLGPVIANRNNDVRAVHCRCANDVRSALSQVGANIIVIDTSSDAGSIIAGLS